MNKLAPWVISAFAGLVFIFLLNASPLSRLGLSIELPIGWVTSGEQACPLEDSVPNNEGIPFSMSRANKTDSCGLDYNNLGKLLNALTGSVLGVLYIFIANKAWSHKQQK